MILMGKIYKHEHSRRIYQTINHHFVALQVHFKGVEIAPNNISR